jgi:hypothetical protein
LDLLTVVPYRSIRGFLAHKLCGANHDLKLVVNFVEKVFGKSGFIVVCHDGIVAESEAKRRRSCALF